MPRSQRKCKAFTLLEALTAAGCTTVLLVAIGSAFLLASRAVPDADHPLFAVSRGAAVLDQLADELRSCRYVTHRGASSVTLVCDDRDGDGVPETIRYSWAGSSGDPLLKEVNGQTARTVLANVRDFTLDYQTASSDLTIPGPPTLGNERIVARFHEGSDTEQEEVTKQEMIGQYFRPSLPAGSTAWKMTRLLYRAVRGSDVTLYSRLHLARPDRTPGALLDEQSNSKWQLSSSMNWELDWFSGNDNLPVDAGYCLVFASDADDEDEDEDEEEDAEDAPKIQTLEDSGARMLNSYDGGSSWELSDSDSLLYYVYGRPYVPDGDRTISRSFLTGVRVTLQAGPDSRHTAMVRTTTDNVPELLSHVWEAGFDGDPTEQDFDRDGADWRLRGGGSFQTSGLSDGFWRADATLDTWEKCNFDKTTICQVRFQAASTAAGGALFWINVDASSSDNKYAPIYARLVLENSGSQTLKLYSKTSDSDSQLLTTVSNLPTWPIEMQLVIEPDIDAVNLRVQGDDYGTFRYTRFVPSGDDRFASVLSGGATSKFDYVRVLVLQ
jgi:hypothetical protein